MLLPLIHTGETINRVLGAITAIEPPFWLGAEPLLRQEIVELNGIGPTGAPVVLAPDGVEAAIPAAAASACSRAASASAGDRRNRTPTDNILWGQGLDVP